MVFKGPGLSAKAKGHKLGINGQMLNVRMSRISGQIPRVKGQGSEFKVIY